MTTHTLDPHEASMAEIAHAYNDYFTSYNELCSTLTKSYMSVLKGLLSVRLTERDEIRFELLENKRLSLYKASIDDSMFSLQSQLVQAPKKEKKDTPDDEETIRNRKDHSKKKPETVETTSTPTVINPIKLIHGGFVPLSIRTSQKDTTVALFNIINVINKRQKVIDLLNQYEQF